MFTKSIQLFCVFFFSAGIAIANEPPPPSHDSKATPQDEKKEESTGHGSGSKPGGLPPWVELEGRIAELSAKIKSKEATLVKLMEEKQHLPDGSAEVKHVISEIVTEHKDLQKMIADYEKKRTTLKYRFPERGAKADRTYKKIDQKSLPDVEAAVGIDGKLNRNLGRMRSQYGSNSTEESGPTPTPSPTQKSEKIKNENKSIENEGTVFINK